jgi:hypothetical protein
VVAVADEAAGADDGGADADCDDEPAPEDDAAAETVPAAGGELLGSLLAAPVGEALDELEEGEGEGDGEGEGEGEGEGDGDGEWEGELEAGST